MPPLREVVRHATPHLIESTFIPLGLFYLFLQIDGVWAAVLAGVGWSYAAIGRRRARGEKLPGMLVLGAMGLTCRTVLAVASRSVFIYFLQGNLSELVLGCTFLVSALIGKPLAERLAHDFWPLPESLSARPAIRSVFVRITLLWALLSLTKATLTIWLLLNTPVAVYVAMKTAVSLAGTGVGVVISVMWFKHATAEPVLAEPVLAEPGLAGPVLAGPVLAGPVLAGPGRAGAWSGTPLVASLSPGASYFAIPALSQIGAVPPAHPHPSAI